MDRSPRWPRHAAWGASVVVVMLLAIACSRERVRSHRATDASATVAGSAETPVVVAPPTTAPPPAGGAPSSPESVVASPVSPFAVRVAWRADSKTAASFAIDVERNGKYVLAALVNPSEREFVFHHRLPNRSYSYRVRAFNARGVSAPSVASTTTPMRGPVATGAKGAKVARPPCVRLPREVDPAKINGRPREALHAPGGRPLYDDPEAANAQRRHLFGEVDGCFRELGVFELQADVTVVPGFVDEGFPLLRAIAGASQYSGAQVLTLRFAEGRYSVADEAAFCGDVWPDTDAGDPRNGAAGRGEDLTIFAPPFESCQRDFE